jgi:hypothetical protein
MQYANQNQSSRTRTADMDTDNLILRKTGPVARIVLNNPGRLNAMSMHVMGEVRWDIPRFPPVPMGGPNTYAASRCCSDQ